LCGGAGAGCLGTSEGEGQADYANQICHFGYFGGILGTFNSIISCIFGYFFVFWVLSPASEQHQSM
jgi:hypothetical protein